MSSLLWMCVADYTRCRGLEVGSLRVILALPQPGRSPDLEHAARRPPRPRTPAHPAPGRGGGGAPRRGRHRSLHRALPQGSDRRSLDEVQITAIRDRLEQMAEVDKRREAILKSLAERDLLTDELSAKLADAQSVVAARGHLPALPAEAAHARDHRPREGPRTAGAVAAGAGSRADPEAEAAKYVDAERGVETRGRRAGRRPRHPRRDGERGPGRARGAPRICSRPRAPSSSKVAPKKEAEGAKFSDYFDWAEPVRGGAVAPHPGHAARASARRCCGCASSRTRSAAVACPTRRFVKNASPAGQQVMQAMEDSYKRLLAPSIESEIAPRAEAARRRRGDPRVCGEPARTADGAAARASSRDGSRSGLSHRLQAGLPRRAGQAAAPRHHLPPHRRTQGRGGRAHRHAPGGEVRDRGHRRRQRHRGPRNRARSCADSACRRRSPSSP